MNKWLMLLLLLPVVVFSQSDLDKAEILYKKGEYSQAKSILEKVLKSEPDNLKALEYMGDIHGANKEWNKSLVCYSKLKSVRPNESNYHYKYGGVLGMIAKESNKFKALSLIGEVKESFEKAIKLNSKHIEARWALIELYLQLPAIIGGSESKAQEYSNELMKLSLVDGFLSKGHIAEYFKRFTEAEKYYKKANSIGGSKATAQRLINLYKNKLDQPQKAKEVLEEYTSKES